MSKLATLPCSLPRIRIPPTTDPIVVAESISNILENLADDALSENAVWRDICALTGSFRTFYGAKAISTAWKDTSKVAKVHSFAPERSLTRVVKIGQGSWIETAFSFETESEPPLLCTAILSIVPAETGEWKIWVMRTILDGLKSQPSADVIEPGALVGGMSKLTNGHVDPPHFDCVIVGGGQAGLSVAGRLKALGVSYVVLEKNDEVGDNWKLRYDSTRCKQTRALLLLHTV